MPQRGMSKRNFRFAFRGHKGNERDYADAISRDTHMTYFWTQKLKERHSIKVEEIIISFYAFLRAGDCVKMAEERTH